MDTHSHDVHGVQVIFEAARAICNLRDVTARELIPAITVLQLFLSSSKPVLRFAAVRTLNKVAMTHPLAVTNCNIDMVGGLGGSGRLRGGGRGEGWGVAEWGGWYKGCGVGVGG